MPSHRFFPLPLLLLLSTLLAWADGPAPAPHLSKETRQQIIHAFDAELVYIRSNFPMGKDGLTLRNGVISPDAQQLQQLMAIWGPAAKPGDLARISDVIIKDNFIRFEINGGPVKKQKWYQHIQVAGAGGSSAPLAPSDQNANPRGSFVDLYFDKYVPEITGPQLKQLLRPVFDFDSKSPVEAYLETCTPKVKEAIKDHHVLVGMNREMVIYAKGRAEKKVREHDGEVEYEEWIFGQPPQDVDFVRFVGDEVIRVETMKVDGQKIVRTEKEVDAEVPIMAQKPKERPPNAPTLRRPGEDMPQKDPQNPSAIPPVGPAPGDPRSDPGSQTPNFAATFPQ